MPLSGDASTGNTSVMKTFRLRTSFKAFVVIAFAFYIVVVSGVSLSIAKGESDPGGIIFFALWVPYSLAFWGYMLWSVPLEITIREDRVVVFRGLWRTIRVPVSDIVSLRGWRWDFSRNYRR
jgi:protein-S-isoprenylcysteine O-methyltransferase Ste14